MRLFRIAKVEAIGCGYWSRARTCPLARSLSHSVHGAQPRIEIAPAAIAIESHGQPTLRVAGVCSLDADYAGIARARRFHGVGLHHVIILLPHPALAADIRAGKKLLQSRGEIVGCAELHTFWHLARHRRLPPGQRTLVYRSIVGQSGIRNLRDNFSMLQHAKFVVVCDDADFYRIESPLFEDAKNFLLAALLRDQQHALLRFAKHDLVRRHASFTLRHTVEFNLNSYAAAPAHLAGRAGEPGRAHILNADDCAGLHGLEAGFE